MHASRFQRASWMTSAPDGVLYLVDGGHIVRVSADGRVSTLARDVAGNQQTQTSPNRGRGLFGLWTD